MYKIQRLGERGIVVTFDELVATDYQTDTNIYLIDTEQTLFVCDTYLGPEAMEPLIREFNPTGEKRVVVINSHYHWDHIWGNCFFRDEWIIAHPLCRERIQQGGELDLERLAGYQMGQVELCLPNLTVAEELVFVEEGVVIFYSPGHSEDSISVYDQVDQILFAGDNVERPLPSYMEWKNLTAYQETLRRYLELDLQWIVPGHRQVLKPEEIEKNLVYLQDILDGNLERYESGEYALNHRSNREVYAGE